MWPALLSLLDRFPELWTLVVTLAWVALSSVFCSLYDRFSPHTDPEWKAALEKRPVWNGVVALFKTMGFNIPGGLRALRVILTRQPPASLAAKPPVSLDEAKQLLRDAGFAVMRVAATVPLPGPTSPAPSDTPPEAA